MRFWEKETSQYIYKPLKCYLVQSGEEGLLLLFYEGTQLFWIINNLKMQY